MEKQQIHTIVSGRVQGVGFRYFVYQIALHYQLLGWVRNRPNRTVEIIAEGSTEDLKAFLVQTAIGPSSSRVDNLITEWTAASNEFDAFKIKRTFL